MVFSFVCKVSFLCSAVYEKVSLLLSALYVKCIYVQSVCVYLVRYMQKCMGRRARRMNRIRLRRSRQRHSRRSLSAGSTCAQRLGEAIKKVYTEGVQPITQNTHYRVIAMVNANVRNHFVLLVLIIYRNR